MSKGIKNANFIDRAIEYFAPSYARDRYKARITCEYLRSYNAASTRERLKNIKTGPSGVNSQIGPALHRLRQRSRHIIRNDEYAKKAKRTVVSSVIGFGITGRFMGDTPRSRALNDAWNQWIKSSNIDFDGNLDFYGIQKLIMGTTFESGSCLVQRIRTTNYEIVPLELKVLEPDFIDISRNEGIETRDSNYIKQGVEFTKEGKKVAYWMYDQHPGETHPTILRNFESTRFDKDEFCYVYDIERPGQIHAVPWIVITYVTAKSFGEYEDAHLTRQKIAACWAGFVKDMAFPEDQDGKFELIKEVAPGIIEALPPGKDIVFPTPPGVEGYGEYTRGQKQRMSAGVGISYESLGDLSQVNFSSAKIGQNFMYENVNQWQWQMIIPQSLIKIGCWFEEAAELAGIVPFSDKKTPMEWNPPKKEFIEPSKETNAIKSQIKGGLKPLSQALGELGYDFDEIIKQYAEDKKKIESLGLNFDTLVNSVFNVENSNGNNGNGTKTDNKGISRAFSKS